MIGVNKSGVVIIPVDVICLREVPVIRPTHSDHLVPPAVIPPSISGQRLHRSSGGPLPGDICAFSAGKCGYDLSH